MNQRIKKQILAMALLTAGLGASTQAATLKLHYEFDEGSGTTAASSLNSNADNTLTLVGASGWATSMPGFGTAMQVTGASGHAEAANAQSWSAQTITGSSTGSMSMALWLNLSSLPSSGVPTLMGTVSDAANGFRNQMLIRADSTTVGTSGKANAWGHVFGNDGGATAANMNTSRTISDMAVGVWTHYALTFDSTTKTATFYVNGSEVDSVANTNWAGYWDASSLVKAVVGSDATTNGASGLYDDARVYDGALTAAEVSALAIPEPSAAILLGLSGLALFRRNRRS